MTVVKDDKTESVIIDCDNLKVDGKQYTGMKGETIKVSPSTAKTMREHGFIKGKGGK